MGKSFHAGDSIKPGTTNTRMRSLVKKLMAPPAYLNPSYVVFDETQGQRDYNIQRNLQEMNFRGLTVTAVFNKLVTPNIEQKRVALLSQARMDWNNQFMVVPLQAERLNNQSQQSFVSQRQMTVPSSYGQFYAFMHALSAAFGTLQS